MLRDSADSAICALGGAAAVAAAEAKSSQLHFKLHDEASNPHPPTQTLPEADPARPWQMRNPLTSQRSERRALLFRMSRVRL